MTHGIDYIGMKKNRDTNRDNGNENGNYYLGFGA